ncbi:MULTISPECIES: DeoR/GlpR family DNA-binding transcription regulator [unclassified Oceanispirochaeta]|uniref:DeoR/GlpR family DNA-binding transcription regulator n=1 Tax=unclassified Oceanispirochaeta TaxID=2635722 RepID=UPI000E09C720|nr:MULTISPECIES: DeoR/GlpR family DNA-binding transcription regulator [unclassified Oceanispirochaeta]MBF9016644.1 DeoR/GlpR transcriptional regulator [Oceanispirochaeta sp. M2]NPD73151.1 DeoR/GlpR transcriptional regulator [Oceanispirochaeta sp. M1]RDG31249.1 DeoR/GlpR transcriptional regulator [Oceanispirochaeta sp. M1]
MNQRQKNILQLVSLGGEVSVQELSDNLDVSLVTIRSDLRSLEDQDLLVRTRGGAALSSKDDIAHRLGINTSAKLRIAKAAAALVNEGDTILLEAGSCIALMARELKGFQSLNVLTNNAFVARQLKDADGVRVILLGGEFQKGSETMVGPMIREYMSYYHYSKVFLGMDGFTAEDGAMCRDIDRAEVMKEFVIQGSEVILLSDSSKFGEKAVRSFASSKEIDRIVTDCDINATMLEKLSEDLLIETV